MAEQSSGQEKRNKENIEHKDHKRLFAHRNLMPVNFEALNFEQRREPYNEKRPGAEASEERN